MMGTGMFFLAMGQTGQTGQQQNPGYFFGVMIIMMIFFYLLMIRPQQRKEKARRAMIEQIKSGDRILFAGGLLGLVSNIKDKTLVVKIADNVKIEIARSAVNQVLDKGERAGGTDL
jgi:preprotein translocase subunit YajC